MVRKSSDCLGWHCSPFCWNQCIAQPETTTVPKKHSISITQYQSPKPLQILSPTIRRFYQPPPSESSTNLPDIGFYLEDTEGSIAGESVESNEHRGRRSETFKFLWAARRSVDQGTTFLDCVGLKSGELFSFEEAKLNQERIYLKMTFRFFPDSYRFLRKEHNSKPYMTAEHNLAYVHNVFSTLRTNGNYYIFSNALTAPALCREPLSPGRYSVRISLLETPVRLADGTEIELEATMPRLEQRLQHCREFLALSRKNPRNDPSRFPIRNNNQTETDVIPPKDDLSGSSIETLKALVLDRDGNCHKLWLPEKQVESTFFFQNRLKRRGCSEGEFEKLGNGNWECRRYQKKIDPFVITGFDSQNNIWLQVGITKYERLNDRRFPHAEAEHVGRIVDIDYKLSFDCKGKEVKVQRQKVWDDHSEWVAIEVLRASDAQ